MSNFLRGVRLALRSLRRELGVSVVIICAWAVGIGATAALFSIYKSVLLQPLPYAAANQLVLVTGQDKDGPQSRSSYATFLDWQRQKGSFSAMAAFRGWSPTMMSDGGAEPLHGMRVTGQFFNVLAVPPRNGRLFTLQEDAPGNNVVVVSYGLWQRRFGGDRDLVGKSIVLNGATYRVVGILGSDFNPVGLTVLGHKPEIWAPLGYQPSQEEACRSCNHLQVIARLSPGTEIRQAGFEMNSIQKILDQQYPGDYTADMSIALVPLKESVVGNVRLMLSILLASVLFLLMLVCANVSHLLLLRATARTRDIAVRTALGAKQWDIIREFLVEAVTVAVLGGILGFGIAVIAVRYIIAVGPGDLPRLSELRVDGTAFLFAMAVTFVVGLLSGLAPTLAIPRLNLHNFLTDGIRSSSSVSHAIVRKLLMTTEVGLALALMISASLFIKSYVRVTEVNPGFETTNLLTLNISTQGVKFDDPRQLQIFFSQALDKTKHLPGVKSAALVSTLPISGDFDQFNICVEGKMQCTSSDLPVADRYIVSPGYLDVMRIPLIQGRTFTDQDVAGVTNVAMVGQTFARQLLSGSDAIGHRIQAGGTWFTVVGVVGDVRQYGLDAAPTPEFYVPFAQQPRPFAALVVRGNSDPSQIGAAIKRGVADIDAGQPVYDIATMRQLVESSTAHRRFVMMLASVFGAFGLFLATLGVYGVVSHSVTQRTQEMGIRMALGAQRVNIFQMVLRQAAVTIAGGLVLGLLGAIALSRFFGSLLFSVTVFDPLILAGATIGLLAITLLACSLPAIRATSVDPVVALRYQ